MIQQSANQNATNSELDAKKIVNNVQLNDELVDNVTNETVLDTNNNGGKF